MEWYQEFQYRRNGAIQLGRKVLVDFVKLKGYVLETAYYNLRLGKSDGAGFRKSVFYL